MTTLVERPTVSVAEPAVVVPTTFASMGYQPSLDGLRALSVAVVLLYHGGFSWMHGGFFGVEVFFVVSGFLITSLLLDERDRSGQVSFRQFWLRRARRLFPALYAVLLAVAASIEEGLVKSRAAIASGAAKAKLDQFVQVTQQLGAKQ